MTPSSGYSWNEVRSFCAGLPGTEEATSYGTPAFKVRMKLFARQHQDDASLIVRVDHDERDVLLKKRPDVFFVTDHYVDHPWVLVHLAAVDLVTLLDVLESAWRLRAPAKLVAEYDAR